MAVIKGGEDAGGSANSGREDRTDPPQRTLVALKKPKKEAQQILTDEQYWDMVGYVLRLCDFGDQQATSDLTIRKYRQFWEFQVNGGFIRNVNLSVFFAFLEDRNEVVILMVYKKEEGRRVPPHVHHLLEDRLEDYLLGSSQGVSVYPRRRSERNDQSNQ